MTDAQNATYEAAKLVKKRAREEWSEGERSPGVYTQHGHQGAARACDALTLQILRQAFPDTEVPAMVRQIEAELVRGGS